MDAEDALAGRSPAGRRHEAKASWVRGTGFLEDLARASPRLVPRVWLQPSTLAPAARAAGAGAASSPVPQVPLILWPLTLARHALDGSEAAVLSYEPTEGGGFFEVRAAQDMAPGEEMLIRDPLLSDAASFAWRGTLLRQPHQARLQLPSLSDQPAMHPRSLQILWRAGCGCCPFRVSLPYSAQGPPRETRDQRPLLACLRLRWLAREPQKLLAFVLRGWAKIWPNTEPLEPVEEEIGALRSMTDDLSAGARRLAASDRAIKRQFAQDPASQRPLIRIRQWESFLLANALKALTARSNDPTGGSQPLGSLPEEEPEPEAYVSAGSASGRGSIRAPKSQPGARRERSSPVGITDPFNQAMLEVEIAKSSKLVRKDEEALVQLKQEWVRHAAGPADEGGGHAAGFEPVRQ